MNKKRTLQFGIMLWILIFVIISIVIFIPQLKEKELTQSIVYWIINIPVVFLMAKWYFKAEKPTWRRGLGLGIAAVVIGTILDLIITIPLFIGPQSGSFGAGLSSFYGDWKLYFGMLEVVVLCILAGAEFDATFSKDK